MYITSLAHVLSPLALPLAPPLLFALALSLRSRPLPLPLASSIALALSLRLSPFPVLHSVWTEAFTLIPSYAQVLDPAKGFWMAPWVRYQIFLPIFLLQLLIAFWSFLILRVLYRMLSGSAASDVREEGETDTEATTGATSVVEGSRSGSPMLGGAGGGGLSAALPIKDSKWDDDEHL